MLYGSVNEWTEANARAWINHTNNGEGGKVQKEEHR